MDSKYSIEGNIVGRGGGAGVGLGLPVAHAHSKKKAMLETVQFRYIQKCHRIRQCAGWNFPTPTLFGSAPPLSTLEFD
jgi:hypothetical protein